MICIIHKKGRYLVGSPGFKLRQAYRNCNSGCHWACLFPLSNARKSRPIRRKSRIQGVLAQSFELPGMGIPTGFPAEALGFADEGLLQPEAGGLGDLNKPRSRHFQQAAVGGVGNGFFHHSRVDCDGLKGLDGNQIDTHSDLQGDLKQVLDPVFANGPAEATNMRGIVGLAVLVIGRIPAAEVLIGDAL